MATWHFAPYILRDISFIFLSTYGLNHAYESTMAYDLNLSFT